MGRERLAMILNHTRTPGQRETTFTMEHIVRAQHLGDANIDAFYEKWVEMVSNMMPDDIPPDNWLRDMLYKKIRNSYDKNVAAREKYARDFAGGGKPGTPAPATPNPKADAKAKAKAKAKEKAAPKAKAKVEAAPVLPFPQPKQHAKGKGKGKDRGKSKSRSASPRDKKKIPCHFHFVKQSCRTGNECEYSHDQKVFNASKGGGSGEGKGGGKTIRSQSRANKTKKVDEPCWHWAKGKCRCGDKCNRRHDPHLFNTAPNTNSTSSNATPALLHDDDSDFETPVLKAASNQVKKKVTFDIKSMETHTYVKKDFVKCTRTSQTESKAHGKTGKSTNEIRKDDHWTYSCRLASSRGKAMAIIMDERGEYSDIDEVLIIVSPTLDIKIKMEMEDDDPVREVFVENYVPHVVGRYGKRGNMMCITVPVERMDLSTYDDSTVNFHTANGVTSSTKRSDIDFAAFDEPAQMHILEDTPSVLSMGKRCQDLGYSFLWPSGKNPYMLDSDGNIIEMIVKDYIPYVSLDQNKKKGNMKKIEKIMEIIPDECPTSDGENMLVIDGESGDELEDISDNVGRPKGESPKKFKKKKRYRRDNIPEVAVGSDAEEAEQMSCHAEDDDPVDGFDGFDDEQGDAGYEPSIGLDVDDVDHDIEFEEMPEEDKNEDDEDVIDVDEEDGNVRLSKRGTLKNEARSKIHLLTHRHKNPYCESCVKAKMKHRKTFRGAFQRKLTKFGDLITFDYVDNRRIAEQDYGDDKTTFVIRDRYTIQAYPSARKDADAVIRAVKQFMGRRKIREAYSDDALQFETAMKALKIPIDTSLAGKTKHNSLAERTNQFVLVRSLKAEVKLRFQLCGEEENEDADEDEYEDEDEVEDADDFDHENEDAFDYEDEDEDEVEDEVEDDDGFDHEDEDGDEDEDDDEFEDEDDFAHEDEAVVLVVIFSACIMAIH
eukprot:s172_g31.t1